jgi:hypothetical protein
MTVKYINPCGISPATYIYFATFHT